MTENNDKNEFLFASYVKNNYMQELEKILDIKIKNIEVSLKNKRSNMRGLSFDGQVIEVSWQLDNDFKKQTVRIQNLIALASKKSQTVIVYGALNFDEETNLELMQDVVFFHEKKYIELVFVQINHEILTLLTNVKKLDTPYIDNPFINKKQITICNS